jgi:dTDP-4-dehydrorhamnose 3,5-epimerase-like enzyme
MNLTVTDTNIPAVKLISQFKASDHRGSFVKPFHDTDLSSAGIHFQMKESFYSISKKNVIRGMHFHLPPYEHDKIVFCTQGAISGCSPRFEKRCTHLWSICLSGIIA